jgi:hypothetical protein
VLSFFPSPEGCTYSEKSWSWALRSTKNYVWHEWWVMIKLGQE